MRAMYLTLAVIIAAGLSACAQNGTNASISTKPGDGQKLMGSSDSGENAVVVAVPQTSVGIKTFCSYDGEPLTISTQTPACLYSGRIFYFGGELGRARFMKDPDANIHKIDANMIPEESRPRKDDIGLKTRCAHGGEAFTIAADTPTLFYNRRLYYFNRPKGLAAFKGDPQCAVAANPLNDLPQAVPPPKDDIGTSVSDAVHSRPLTVTAQTPALTYAHRMFYFLNPADLHAFRECPQAYVADNPAAKPTPGN